MALGELCEQRRLLDRLPAALGPPSEADAATWAQPSYSGNRVFVKDVSSLTLWATN
jgi:hypothetical protein